MLLTVGAHLHCGVCDILTLYRKRVRCACDWVKSGAGSTFRVSLYNRKSTRNKRYTALQTLLVLILSLRHVASSALGDDCEYCAVPAYATVKGLESCPSCGSSAFDPFPGPSRCTDCVRGTFPEKTAYAGWCSVRATQFQLQQQGHATNATMYEGPMNTTWFDIPTTSSVSVRSILNSMRNDWAIGTRVRIQSALGLPHFLNPLVLQRTSNKNNGRWAPANTNPRHTSNSTRYYFISN